MARYCRYVVGDKPLLTNVRLEKTACGSVASDLYELFQQHGVKLENKQLSRYLDIAGKQQVVGR